MTIRELREKALRIAHEARDHLKTIKEDGSNAAEVEAKFDEMIAQSDALEARAARLEKVETREKAYETADERRPTEDAEAREKTGETAETRFTRYLRGELPAHEARAQTVGTASEGGYLVPTELSKQLVLSMKAYGPMIEGGPATWFATDGGNPITIPTLNDTANAGAVIAEGGTAGDVSLTFGQKQLDAYKRTSGVFKVSRELLSDSAIDVVQIVNNAMAERLGRQINIDLTTGDGSGDPEGVVIGSSLGKTAASATAIAADELLDLLHSVDPAYRGNAGFMMHDSIKLAIRKLKGSDGQYIWQESARVGEPSLLFGHPVYANQNMQASIATGTKTVLFGDFSKYWARRAGPILLRRLDERYAETDMVGFVGFVRIDGVVTDAGAIKHLIQA